MSRWIENFKNHAFQKVWLDILEESKKLNLNTTTSSDVQELARLKKVIIYIDELLNACDPEIIQSNVWDAFNEQSTECLKQIYLFNQNNDMGHLQSSNANLDTLLTSIRPYILNSSYVAQATKKAFEAYSKTINEELDRFNLQVKNNVNDIEIFYHNSKEINEKIDKFNTDLFVDTDDLKSFNYNKNFIFEELTSHNDKVKDYYKDLLIDTADKKSKKSEIEEAVKFIYESKNNIDIKLKEIDSNLSDFNKFYEDTFGKNEINNGKYQDGLKKKLEDGFTKCKSLEDSINKLLPGAVSSGLASSYNAMRASFDPIIKTNTIIFYSTLVTLVLLSLITITSEVGKFYIKFIDISDFNILLLNFLYKTPLIAPVIWLAFFASKRRSEAQRLQQEYAHKEAITRSYQSFKKQIQDLGEENEALMSKLLDTAISAIAYNASATLDKKHGDKMPIHELLDNTASKISNPLNP